MRDRDDDVDVSSFSLSGSDATSFSHSDSLSHLVSNRPACCHSDTATYVSADDPGDEQANGPTNAAALLKANISALLLPDSPTLRHLHGPPDPPADESSDVFSHYAS